MSDPSQRRSRIAEFVRGYFVWLEQRGISAALLHGWEDGFEGEISDIDHVMDAAAFRNVAGTVNEYCAEKGWRLCQVLRHEDTAAFCVCSAMDDPGCVVALDACSDYRRNGFVFLDSNELLRERQPLDWGGFRLSSAMELRYRFIKAAAKDKPADEVIPGILKMDENAQNGFAEWLHDPWTIGFDAWNSQGLEKALAELTQHCGPSTNKFRPANCGRIARRITRPDGLLLVLPTGQPEIRHAIEETFSGLYFRRAKITEVASLGNRFDLIRSVLVIAGSTAPGVTLGLDPKSIARLPSSLSAQAAIDWLAQFLNKRCREREKLKLRESKPLPLITDH